MVGWSFADDKVFKGEMTDDMCGRSHMMERVTAKECADKCVAAGAKYALFVPDDERMYAVDDQDNAKNFAGENVIVRGSLGNDGKTIKVSSIVRQE